MNETIANLNWSEERVINTRNGPTKMKSAPPSEQFWEVYKEHKQTLSDAGFSISKFGGSWAVNWWSKQDKFLMPLTNEEEPEPVVETPLELEPLVNKKGVIPYQEALTQQVMSAMKRHGASLNGCGTGVGKTYITLFAARELGVRLLVICPKTITTDWVRAALDVGVDLIGAHGWEWIKTGKTPYAHWQMKTAKKKVGGQTVETRVRDKLVWDLPPNTWLVFDEIHRASAIDTQNAEMVVQAHTQGIPICGLSATIANDPTKLRAVGKVLGLHKDGRDFYNFMREHGVKEVKFGYRTAYKFGGTSLHLKKIHKAIFPVKGCRVRAEDLGDAFPETQIIAKSYVMDTSKEIEDAYNEMQMACEQMESDSGLSSSERSSNILAEIMRARKKVEYLKIPLFVSLTRDAMEEGNSVFIAVNFTDTLEELVEQLDVKCFIRGGQKPETRRGMIDSFQSNAQRIIVGNIKASREGLNLQDVHGGHPRLALIMPTPSAVDMRQVLGRVHRVKGKTPSIQRICFAAGTIEESVCEGLATKLDAIELLMDGDLQKGIFPPGYSKLRPTEEA